MNDKDTEQEILTKGQALQWIAEALQYGLDNRPEDADYGEHTMGAREVELVVEACKEYFKQLTPRKANRKYAKRHENLPILVHLK